jgi:hypothetical protein
VEGGASDVLGRWHGFVRNFDGLLGSSSNMVPRIDYSLIGDEFLKESLRVTKTFVRNFEKKTKKLLVGQSNISEF